MHEPVNYTPNGSARRNKSMPTLCVTNQIRKTRGIVDLLPIYLMHEPAKSSPWTFPIYIYVIDLSPSESSQSDNCCAPGWPRCSNGWSFFPCILEIYRFIFRWSFPACAHIWPVGNCLTRTNNTAVVYQLSSVGCLWLPINRPVGKEMGGLDRAQVRTKCNW